MAWLAGGVLYSLVYLVGGFLLRGHSSVLLSFRIVALLIPPMAGVGVITRRRHEWSGCQWLFWATMALGLMMSAIGLVGWTVDDLMLDRQASWLGWHTVFALFGGAAPLFALLAQPHRGRREELTATTAVDIAGIAVMTGFLYSHFVVSPDLSPVTAQQPSGALLVLCEFQALIVCLGVTGAAFVARNLPWGRTYGRLAIGLFVNLIILSITNAEIWQGMYRPGFVYDVIWILPFAFFPWAAATAPASEDSSPEGLESAEVSRPWIVFGALALIPVLDFGLRAAVPLGALDQFRDMFMVITIFSVLPLLMARLAVERGDARQADGKRRLLAAATEQANDLISIMSPDGRIDHANSAFCHALGATLSEVVGAPTAQFLADESQGHIDVAAEGIGRDGVWRGSLVRRRKDGSTFPSSSTVVALSDEQGHVAHFVAVERDVTKDSQLRDQLIHSERLAAVGQLVSGVAHELNNPLQSVVGFTELLLQSERRQDTREDLEQIRSEAARAAKIVRNLLAFVRRSGTERVVTNLNEIVRSTIALRAYELAVANIEVEEHYAETLPDVSVNREEIQQVLLNLIMNAEQAMGATRGSGCLVVHTAMTEDGPKVEIQDNGPGIPEALAGRVFEPFFSTKGVGQGTGLGLSIALGIAEAHGGALTLPPTPLGACFRLVLQAASAQPAPVVEPPASSAVGKPLAGRRALVADDELLLRQLLQRLLVARGFVVDVVEHGFAAMALVEKNHYDIVLCDISMPKMGGLAVYDELRASRPQLVRALVLITGDILDVRLKSILAAGEVPVLSKPFSAVKLDEVVNRVLGDRSLTRKGPDRAESVPVGDGARSRRTSDG
jgi:PAS domain S-box-containing protein